MEWWGGGGGGGGWIYPLVLLKNRILTVVYCLETSKFVVTTNWLQLNIFLLYGNPVVKTKSLLFFLVYRNPKFLVLAQLQPHLKCSKESYCMI